MTIRLMGQEFERLDHFKAAFPAFKGDDAVRAIRAGATTPMEVEVACLEYRKRGRERLLATVRQNAKVVNEMSKKARERKAQKVAKKRSRAA